MKKQKEPREKNPQLVEWWHPGNSTPQRPQFFLARARTPSPRHFFFHFPSFRKNDAALCERRADRRDPPSPIPVHPRACIAACTGKFKSTNSVQQFYCNEKNGRRGSAARQIRRRLNIKWDMTGALFLFRFHVLAPLRCVWARANELCELFFLSHPLPSPPSHFPSAERERIVIGSDQTWPGRNLEAETRRRRGRRGDGGKDCAGRCKRPITQESQEDSNPAGNSASQKSKERAGGGAKIAPPNNSVDTRLHH